MTDDAEAQPIGIDEIGVGKDDDGDAVVELCRMPLAAKQYIALLEGNILPSQTAPDFPAFVAANVRRYRRAAGLGQKALAERSVVSRRMIGAIEGVLTIEEGGRTIEVAADAYLLDNRQDQGFANRGAASVRFYRCTSW